MLSLWIYLNGIFFVNITWDKIWVIGVYGFQIRLPNHNWNACLFIRSLIRKIIGNYMLQQSSNASLYTRVKQFNYQLKTQDTILKGLAHVP